MSNNGVNAREILRAWGRILSGYQPNISIEITKECPLRCLGCYAYGDEHLGGDVTLRGLSDLRGDELVERFMALIDRHRPLHVSVVGGEPLVRYRELGTILPRLAERGIHAQVVTSAVRPIPLEWAGLRRLQLVVSIDGLQPEHDERRTPATYDRILRHIAGHQITVHCTVTRQQARREGYLEAFLRTWQENPNTRLIWVSLYTPQKGELSAERLTSADRARVITELRRLRPQFPKLQMGRRHAGRLRQAAAIAGGMHLRADDRVLLRGPRAPHYAVPVRWRARLRQLRLYRVRRAGGDWPPPTARRHSGGTGFLRLDPRGPHRGAAAATGVARARTARLRPRSLRTLLPWRHPPSFTRRARATPRPGRRSHRRDARARAGFSRAPHRRRQR